MLGIISSSALLHLAKRRDDQGEEEDRGENKEPEEDVEVRKRVQKK